MPIQSNLHCIADGAVKALYAIYREVDPSTIMFVRGGVVISYDRLELLKALAGRDHTSPLDVSIGGGLVIVPMGASQVLTSSVVLTEFLRATYELVSPEEEARVNALGIDMFLSLALDTNEE